MPLIIDVTNETGAAVKIQIDRLPDICPFCKRSIKPKPIGGAFDSAKMKGIRVAFLCPSDECREIFTGAYVAPGLPLNQKICHLVTTKSLILNNRKVFSNDIEDLSPLFVETYNQSLTAEDNNLDQIAGPGFRKSLEFLVKDFLVDFVYKDDEDNSVLVKKAFLGKCIKDHIDESRIKTCAERAAWLGNDETHYTRRWVDKDISDLKILVEMTVNWIDLVVKSDKYLESMPEGQ